MEDSYLCGYLKIKGLTEVRESLLGCAKEVHRETFSRATFHHTCRPTRRCIFLLCLVIKEYPTLTTFFAGEIISRKRPFLTRKWDADEDVDRKHWVRDVRLH